MAVRLFTSECCRAVIQHLATKELSRRAVVRLVALAVLSSLGAFYASLPILKITLGTVSTLISLFLLSKIFARYCFKPPRVQRQHLFPPVVVHYAFAAPPPPARMIPGLEDGRRPPEPQPQPPPSASEPEEGVAPNLKPQPKLPPEVLWMDEATMNIPSGSSPLHRITLFFNNVEMMFTWNQALVANLCSELWEGATNTATATQNIKELFIKALELGILTPASPRDQDIATLLAAVRKKEDVIMAFAHERSALKAAWNSTWHMYTGPDYGSSAQYPDPMGPAAVAARKRIIAELASYGKTTADLDLEEDD